MAQPDAYLIWSHEHGGWWRSRRLGYTPHLHEAGVYSRQEALLICTQALGGWRPGRAMNEIPVARADMQEIALADAERAGGIERALRGPPA